jgi:hypothetical protein
MSKTKPNAEFLALDAAADFLGNGAIEINMYETEIMDLVRRSTPAIQRFDSPPATGHPHRYFEQTAIATAAFTDPRNITPTPTGPTRVERSALIRAITNQTNLSLFDIDVTRQQGQFAYLEAKDINDLVSSVQVTRGTSIWIGNATTVLDSGSVQYCGILTQVTQQATIALGSSIIDGLKTQVATMVALVGFTVKPTAIYLNPILNDYLDQEAKAQQVFMNESTVEGGLVVKTLQTQAGPLPLIGDPYVPSDTTGKYGFGAPPAGYKNYYAAILTDKEVELPYVGGQDQNPNPRIFQLGLLGGLQGQYVVIKFDSCIAKGPSYAHAVVAVVRP